VIFQGLALIELGDDGSQLLRHRAAVSSWNFRIELWLAEIIRPICFRCERMVLLADTSVAASGRRTMKPAP
jgi:hypothetical protein